MDAQNIGDMLHIIILSLILVWLLYHQWLLTKVLDLMRQMTEKLAENCKEATKESGKNDGSQDSDCKIKF